MRTLSSPLSTAFAAPVQQPGVLVQVGFSPVQRWSSRGTLSWNGFTWTGVGMRVDDLQVGPLKVSGTLVLKNHDDVAGGLVLGQGVQDRAITIYGFDGAATASGDVVWLADAVGGLAEIDTDEVRIALRHRSEFVYSPRTYVRPSSGFTNVLPVGTVLRINGQDFKLER